MCPSLYSITGELGNLEPRLRVLGTHTQATYEIRCPRSAHSARHSIGRQGFTVESAFEFGLEGQVGLGQVAGKEVEVPENTEAGSQDQKAVRHGR